ncbi:MAG: alginate lyase family protein [bacterium]|nr:alginate lyase family protein [bacterium]
MLLLMTAMCFGAVDWQHPGGMVTDATLVEVRVKLENHAWARQVYNTHKRQQVPWLDASYEDLRRVFPTACGNVYHNYSCPTDRCRLTFDPFEPAHFTCPVCKEVFPADTDAGIYTDSQRYKGTMYDGWACMFYQAAGARAGEMALIARIENDDARFRRAIEILMLYADTIEGLPTQVDPSPQMNRILTYHREGDNKVLFDLACAYELVRDRMTSEQRARFETVVLQRMLDDLMLEPIYTYDHNNVYQWHRTIVQTAIALERDDLIDWSFGFGAYSPESQPDHRSMRLLLDTHFKPDGAFWEMCSGYHLYPVYFLCEFAVLSHRLSAMDPVRFPPDQYDMTDRASRGGTVIHGALHWFLSMAMPNRSMPTIGDSPQPEAGLDNYFVTAEVGYRFFDVKAVGDYPAYREGQRRWSALLYGAPEIVQHETPFTSSFLSSGWVSLRNEWGGNRVWAGLNGLIPGGGHQHGDRLGLLLYSHDTLLALEKGTPYNESTTRVLATFSPMHNTVTVDMQSQTQGEALTPEQTPEVVHFHAGEWLQFAEICADHLYSQTTVFRRAVAVIEDVAVDLFRVEGGDTHDWMLHHAGDAPDLSVETVPAAFEPVDWLYNGTDNVRVAASSAAWDARWHVDDVTSRLTMAGAADTSVYQLETYPIGNAVVTTGHPPCQTLCVRRTNDAPFLAVWDAWRGTPNLEEIAFTDDGGVMLRTRSHTYHLRFGSGESTFEDGTTISTNGAFAITRDRDAAVMIGASFLNATSQGDDLAIKAESNVTAVVTRGPDEPTIRTYPAIQHDTHGGEDHPRPPPDVRVDVPTG